MTDLSNFQRNKIISVRMADANVMKTAEMISLSRITANKVNASIGERKKNLFVGTKFRERTKTF